MNIKQALKLKVQLGKELTELYHLIRTNNSTIVDNPKHYSVIQLMDDAKAKFDELIDLKTKIHLANGPVYDKIFKLSELKVKASMYGSIGCTEGKQTQYNNSEPVYYQVEINVKDIKSMVKGIEEEIRQIQDELDTFNAITEIQ